MSCGSGMDGRPIIVATRKVRQSDGYHIESGQDMAPGVGNHERVSVI